MCVESLDIIYRDDLLIAVAKPAGLLVHRGYGRDRTTVCDLLRDGLRLPKVHALHRLDRQTSGVLLFALHSEIARTLGEDFMHQRVAKRYLALVRGEPPREITVDHPVPRSEGGPRVPARTLLTRLAVARIEPRYLSLVEARPRTGRFHQIRRHLKHISHPIIGDANYGKGALNRDIASRYGLHRMALHAAELRFVHPRTGEEMTLTAPIPRDLEEPLQKMGLAPLDPYISGTRD